METFKLLYIAIGPGAAIAVYIYFSDKWDPEPKKLAIRSFLLGGLACFPAFYFEGVVEKVFGLEELLNDGFAIFWGQTVLYAFFGVALPEELCKFLFLKAFLFDEREFNEPFDGIVYGGLIGCGFATVENILYVFPEGHSVGIARMLTAVPGHAFFGIILGYFVGRAKFSLNSGKHLINGLVLVVVLHGVYDIGAFSHASWAFILIFGIVFLGIYLGLKAKRSLEKHSAVIEFSAKEFYPIKGRKKNVPILLKGIRDLLSKGKLKPDDSLIEEKSGKIKSIKEIFSSKIISQYRGLTRTPPDGQPVRYFLIFYGATFGLYLYFWFLRSYRDFASLKKLKLNPELRAVGFLISAIIPYFIYGVILGSLHKAKFGLAVEVSFNLFMAGVETVFLFYLLQMIKRFLKRKMKGSFSLPTVVLCFFVASSLRKLASPDMPFYLLYEITFAFLQGGILAMVQRDLNLYWEIERKESADTL